MDRIERLVYEDGSYVEHPQLICCHNETGIFMASGTYHNSDGVELGMCGLSMGSRLIDESKIRRILYEGGYSIERPGFHCYHDGQGVVPWAGNVFNKDGELCGHADPPGPLGPQGVAGKGAPL
jgi:hypothetical protein